MSATRLQHLNEACNAYYTQSSAACKEAFYSSIQKPAQACWNCSATLTLEKIKKCSRCHLAIYCGQDCQRRDWAVHKQPEGCEGLSARFDQLRKLYSVPSEKCATAEDLLENGRKIEGELSGLQRELSGCLKSFLEATEGMKRQEKLIEEFESLKFAYALLGSPKAVSHTANCEQVRQQLDDYKHHMSEIQQQIEKYTKVVGKLKADWSYNQQLLKDLRSPKQ